MRMNDNLRILAEATRDLVRSIANYLNNVREMLKSEFEFDATSSLKLGALWACIYIGGAEGGISELRRYLINFILEEDLSETAMSLMRRKLLDDPDQFESFMQLLQGPIWILSVADTRFTEQGYKVENDAIIKLISCLGLALTGAESEPKHAALAGMGKSHFQIVESLLRMHALKMESERQSEKNAKSKLVSASV